MVEILKIFYIRGDTMKKILVVLCIMLVLIGCCSCTSGSPTKSGIWSDEYSWGDGWDDNVDYWEDIIVEDIIVEDIIVEDIIVEDWLD